MICLKCIGGVYPQAISIGECKICHNQTYTPHMPPYTICTECSKEYNLCEQCGISLDREETHKEY